LVSNKTIHMNIRKNQARLSTAEKTAFVNSILQLKTATPSQMGLANRYDDYVQIHMDSMMLPDGSDRVPGWAHRGPAFGPWHRALLRNLELDLQDAANDSAITLPYWDWTVNQTASPAAGSPWTDDFMGQMDASTDIVNSGPFRQGNWVLSVLEAGTNESFLRRALGRGQFQPNQPPFPIATLPTPANVSTGKQEAPYDSAPWARGANPSFRDRLEGWHGPGSIHNRVHLWVGGTMLPSTSPNDPVFFLHHCNIDRIWAQWQQDHTALPYVPAANTPGAPQGHVLTDSMQPWGGPITVQSTLDHHALGYMYDDEMTPAHLPAPVAQPIRFPRWQHVPPTHQHAPMRMGMMFDISPEDKAAGGHALR
jgi:tyrosinase